MQNGSYLTNKEQNKICATITTTKPNIIKRNLIAAIISF
jgi:hypothetical protein